MAIYIIVFKNVRIVICVIVKNKWGCVEKKNIFNKFGIFEKIFLGINF